MPSPAHTPPPWTFVDTADGRQDGYVVGGPTAPGAARPRAICRMTARPTRGERLANAALITAAPELLRDLEWAIHFIEETATGPAGGIAADRLRRTTAKARGEAPQ